MMCARLHSAWPKKANLLPMPQKVWPSPSVATPEVSPTSALPTKIDLTVLRTVCNPGLS